MPTTARSAQTLLMRHDHALVGFMVWQHRSLFARTRGLDPVEIRKDTNMSIQRGCPFPGASSVACIADPEAWRAIYRYCLPHFVQRKPPHSHFNRLVDATQRPALTDPNVERTCWRKGFEWKDQRCNTDPTDRACGMEINPSKSLKGAA